MEETAIIEAVRKEMATHLSLISQQMGELKQEIKHHNEDRFAHNWDHNLLITSQQTIGEWNDWRAGVEKWRWTMMGALTFLFIEITVLGTLLSAGHILFH